MKSAPARIKFLFTSDEHGRFKQAGKIQERIKAERAENPNTILVSSGDVFQGTPESDLQGGYPSLDILDKAGYQAVELGNHDFDNGLEFVREWVKEAEYPILGANIIDQETDQILEGVKPYEVFERDGVKVGLIGLATPDTCESTSNSKLREELRFDKPAEVARHYRDELKAQGVDVVGVLSHLGAEDDVELAESVDGLGFILGGHTHKEFHEPLEVNGALICQPGAYRENLGILEFTVDPETDRVSEVEHELVPVEELGKSGDNQVGEAVSGHLCRVDKALATVVSFNEKPLSFNHARDGEFEQLLSEAVVEQTGADLFLINRKSIRADLDQGDVTAGELFNSYPFGDSVVTLEITKDILEGLLNLSEQYADHRSLLHTQVGFEMNPKDKKVRNLSISRGNGEYIMDPVTIKVATSSFLADGGLGYDFGDAEVLQGPLIREAIEEGLDKGLGRDYQDHDAKDVFAELRAASNNER